MTEPYDLSTDIINKKPLIERIIKKIDFVYRDVKKNEITPDTDYLFNGTSSGARSNLDKTIERLDKLSKISQV